MMTAELMLSKRPVLRFTAALFFLLNRNDALQNIRLKAKLLGFRVVCKIFPPTSSVKK